MLDLLWSSQVIVRRQFKRETHKSSSSLNIALVVKSQEGRALPPSQTKELLFYLGASGSWVLLSIS